jgi:hypothetical protein
VLTFVFPIVLLTSTILMWPGVLENSPFILFLAVVLFISPAASLFWLLLRRRLSYPVVGLSILFVQILILGTVNNWLSLLVR